MILTAAVMGAAILINSVFFSGRFTDPLIRLVSRPLGYVWGKFTPFQSLSYAIINWKDLSKENKRLKEENGALIGRLAQQEEIEHENSYLRDALDLPGRIKTQLAEAGTFGIVFGPEGYRALLNRGEADGVRLGAIVTTAQGAIVGSVAEVLSKTSRVRLVQDVAFEITASVVGKSTVGIVKGSRENGLKFELVAQGDSIAEGDVVISSGADRYPGGLVLGTVSHVVESETSLFKEVKITPAFKNPVPMKVFFIR